MPASDGCRDRIVSPPSFQVVLTRLSQSLEMFSPDFQTQILSVTHHAWEKEAPLVCGLSSMVEA